MLESYPIHGHFLQAQHVPIMQNLTEHPLPLAVPRWTSFCRVRHKSNPTFSQSLCLHVFLLEGTVLVHNNLCFTHSVFLIQFPCDVYQVRLSLAVLLCTESQRCGGKSQLGMLLSLCIVYYQLCFPLSSLNPSAVLHMFFVLLLL